MTSYLVPFRFGVNAAYCSNFGHCVFDPLGEGSFGTTYDFHLRLIGKKRIVDLLLVLIELSLGVTAEAQRQWRHQDVKAARSFPGH